MAMGQIANYNVSTADFLGNDTKWCKIPINYAGRQLEVMETINSDINIIGGIPDFGLIEAALEYFTNGKDQLELNELVVTK